MEYKEAREIIKHIDEMVGEACRVNRNIHDEYLQGVVYFAGYVRQLIERYTQE